MNIPEDPPWLPRMRSRNAPRKRSFPWTARVAAGIIIAAMVIARIPGRRFFGALTEGSANAPAPDGPGAPGAGLMPSPAPAINRAVPVVTGMSLTPHES